MRHRTLIASSLLTAFTLLACLPPPAAAQQLPPGVSMEQWNQLSAEQQAAILARLQQSGAAEQQAAGGEEMTSPEDLVPSERTTPTVTRVEQEELFIEDPYDFGAIGSEIDSLRELPIFGLDIFTLAPGTFEPPVYGPVGPDYELGPGDQIIITMWGTYQEVLDRTLTREGYILVPNVGQVVLAGRTLEEAKQHLLQRMTPSYQALDYGREGATAFLDVSLGKLRAITVYVLGDARRPGAYTLSSVSTAFTALYSAGGPSRLGSMRDIQVIRGTEGVATLDAYDLVLRGDKSDDVRLQHEDILFIPPIGRKVALTGRVLRPAQYELKGDERLGHVIGYAGGLTPSALQERAQVSRILPPEQRGETPWVQVVIDVDLQQTLAEPARSLELADGDVLRVLGIPGDRRNFVVVQGAVWNPGRLEYRGEMRVRDALQRAGGVREEALDTRLEIIRTNPDETTTQLSVVLEDALAGDEGDDILLAHRDRLTVYSIHDVRPRDRVSIFGRVDEPGSYLLHEDMTVMDLIMRAGGLTKDAWDRAAEVARLQLVEDGSVSEFEIFQVPIDTSYSPRNEEPCYLRDFDQVFVRTRPQWETQRLVALRGEVLFPGEYALRREDETLADVVGRAGGLTPYAYPEGARFHRRREGAGRINIRLDEALGDPAAIDNLVMQPGDSLYVPPRVDFVSVRGAVEYPTSVLYRPGKKPGYYIAQAGGYTERADGGRMRVVLPNGSIWQPRWWILPDPEVEPGSEIHVPLHEETERDAWEVIRDTTAILSSLTTVLLLVWQITRSGG
ncbi:MAG: SLBB domain-containing protein [bacterium]